jgi:hypothetical protein
LGLSLFENDWSGRTMVERRSAIQHSPNNGGGISLGGEQKNKDLSASMRRAPLSELFVQQ